MLIKLTPLLSGALIFVSSGLVPPPAAAAVTFYGDWADFGTQFRTTGREVRFMDGQRVEWVAGDGPNHWRVIQAKGDDRLQMENDPSSPKHGAVLRVEVRPGDGVGYSGERAEVSDMQHEGGHFWVTGESGHEIYGVSIKLDPDWQPPLNDSAHRNTWGLFMQLHSPNPFDSPPAIALSADTQFRIQTLAGDLIAPDGKRQNGGFLPFSNSQLRPGHWVEFMIDVVWAYDNQGALTVYRRDEGESTFNAVLKRTGLPTLQFDSQLPNSKNANLAIGPVYVHYWKVGYYRSPSPGVTSRLWLGPVVRGTSLAEVAVAAFGQR